MTSLVDLDLHDATLVSASITWSTQSADVVVQPCGPEPCFAAVRFFVDGARLDVMYREAPGFPEDRSWRFCTGTNRTSP